MSDNYYKILGVSNKSSPYKIAVNYKQLCCAILNLKDLTEEDKARFLKINAAFEVLRNKKIRKYYDVLCSVASFNKPTNIPLETIEKYNSILNNYAGLGIQKAEKILKDKKLNLATAIKRSMLVSFLIGTVKFYTRYPKFMFTALAGFFTIIGGFVLLFFTLKNADMSFFVISVFLIVLGMINLIINYRNFTIDLMNDSIDISGKQVIFNEN